MKLKPTVNTEDVQPALWYGLGVCEAVYARHGMTLVVTCLRDSHENKPGSLHNKGVGADLRTRNIPPSTVELIVADIRKALDGADGFDIVLEVDHVHLEYDPKLGENWITRVA